MHAYTEILKPSVITHSLLLASKPGGDPILVVVRGNSLLEVFSDTTSSSGPRWIGEFPLQGAVTHLDSIGDGLLVVTFLQAKMVVLEWDATRLEFLTRSLHYYEKLAEQSNYDVADSRNHRVSVDRSNQCLSFWFQPEFAVFVSFKSLADPLLAKPSTNRAQSSIINMNDLMGQLGVSRIVDMALLPAYNEPTLAVLAWNQPSWSGLVGADGSNTKSLHVVTIKPQANKKLIFKRIIHIPEIGHDFHEVVALNRVPRQLALLLGADQFHVLNESGELLAIAQPTAHPRKSWDARLENCYAVQVPGEPFALAALQSGAIICIDLTNTQAEIKQLRLENPTSICALGTTLVISSRTSRACVCQLSVTGSGHASEVSKASLGSSLQEMYDALVKQPQQELALEVQVTGELASHGALSSVATIDNGLACGTENGVLIVERELPFEELDTAPLNIDVEPGKFWLVGTAMPKNPVLITTGSSSIDPATRKTNASSVASYNAELDEEVSPKRRRLTEKPEKHFTAFSELYPSRRKKSQPSKFNIEPRGVASDQLTLAARELDNTLLVVQSKALALLDSRNWKTIKRESIPVAHFAEIRGDHILVVGQDHVCRVYVAKTLELVVSADNVELASVSSSMLLHTRNNVLSLLNLEKDAEVLNYDVGNLDLICRPLSGGQSSASAINGSAPANVGQSGSESPDGQAKRDEKDDRSDQELIAVFALTFNDTNYVGVHMGRLFTIYEYMNAILIKRFTVPFVVNQSPIYVPEDEVLVFPGAKSHIVVKGRQAGFQCHRLQLYGDQLIDVVLSPRLTKGRSTHELAWLDSKETLHFAQLDHSIDFLSNSLPIRHIALNQPGVTIKEVGYHDEFATVVVGANFRVPRHTLEAAATDSDRAESGTEAGPGDEAEDTTTASGDAEPKGTDADTSEVPASVYEGRIYVLPLTTYKFQTEPVASFAETLLCLKVVDYGDPGDKQMLAVGSASSTPELEETNGHIRVYNIQENDNDYADGQSYGSSGSIDGSSDNIDGRANGDADGRADDAGDTSAERDEPPPLELQEFASEYVRGAVSAISELMGFLAVSHGQQIHLYNFHKKLEPIGFYDTQVYMQDIKAVRNIMILGERLRGPRLLNFALNPHRVDLLASSDPVSVPANSALAPRNPVTTAVDGVCGGIRGDLVVMSTTADGRLQLLQYDPDNPMSTGGPRLVPLASFYTGRTCNSTTSAQIHATDDLIVYGAANDGSVFCVKPLLEGVFRTLFVLTQQIIDKEPAVAGLNPRMHRATLSTMASHSQQLIDVNYAQQFWQLPRDRQAVYARRLGFEGMTQVQRALNPEGRDALKL